MDLLRCFWLAEIVWRLKWEASKSDDLKNRIITYNLEDCSALKILLSELRDIGQAATTRSDVDFADAPKQNSTASGQRIHNLLEAILRSAHAEYKKNRICVAERDSENEASRKGPGGLKGHPAFRRVIPVKAGKIIRVRRPTKCQRHSGQTMKMTDKLAAHTVIDLVFTKSGYRKTITKYVGRMSYCRQCERHHLPPGIKRFKGRLYGHGFRAWAVYQRITLRHPYSAICQVVEDLFGESITDASIINFMVDLAEHYVISERMLLKRILASPFIHVDETKINVQGADHYVWVLTDGTHVVFRLTETREAALIQGILKGYKGVLITDFYGGYDSCKCRQQKCLVHLIRDLNDDLWKNPFDLEFESFLGAFRDVLVPIVADVDKYGLKRCHLSKHGQKVDR